MTILFDRKENLLVNSGENIGCVEDDKDWPYVLLLPQSQNIYICTYNTFLSSLP